MRDLFVDDCDYHTLVNNSKDGLDASLSFDEDLNAIIFVFGDPSNEENIVRVLVK